MIAEFVPIARAVIGLSSLKIISFGPRPLNFLACNAPIKQLYNLGVEKMCIRDRDRRDVPSGIT